MKLGKIVNSNKKGQIVIPQEYRIQYDINEYTVLNLVPHPTGILIQPIKSEVIPNTISDTEFEEILNRTAGAWYNEDLSDYDKRDELELKAAQKAKKQDW